MTSYFIVEDEPAARDKLSDHIKRKYYGKLTLVGVAGSVSEAVQIIPEVKPDLLLMDIDLPDGNAFDILNNIESGIPDRLIFITAYNNYAIKAIKYSALDYILKPWDTPELDTALEKALSFQGMKNTQLGIEVLRSNSGWSGNIDNVKPVKIALKTSEDIFLINIGDIIRLESESNYCRFVLVGGKTILISKTLKEYDELLSFSGFFRAHQSHLVNIEHILSYRRQGGGSLIMSDKSVVPVSHRKKEKLKSILDSYTS